MLNIVVNMRYLNDKFETKPPKQEEPDLSFALVRAPQ